MLLRGRAGSTFGGARGRSDNCIWSVCSSDEGQLGHRYASHALLLVFRRIVVRHCVFHSLYGFGRRCCSYCGAHAPGYTALMCALLGRFGEVAAIFSIVLANWGSCIAYTKYIGDNLAKFFPAAHLAGSTWSMLITVPLLACAFVEDVSKMACTSFLGLLAGQAFACLVVAQAVSHGSTFADFAASEPVVRWSSVQVAMGLAVFCKEGMVIMTPSVYGAMKSPQRGYPRALLAMTVFFTLNYMIVAVAGYFRFGYVPGVEVRSELTLGFDTTPVNSATVCLYLVQLLLSFPPVLFTLFSSIEQAWLPGRPLLVRRALRVAIIAAMGAVAVAVPRFGDFLAVAGGLGNSLGIYVLLDLAALRATSQGLLVSEMLSAELCT
mmetsp:Transcript_88604/g.284450  ORF Transcript_88604/g.284450 Transcript_88604/m.284450 type:complete len:379 (+) Transcript_88604:181-1317(+)